MKNAILYGGILLGLLFGVACGNTAPEEQEQQTPATTEETKVEVAPTPSIQLTEESITGRWQVIGATRNMKRTESVNGAFFEFLEAGQLYTNIEGEDKETTYQLSGDKIVEEQMTYQVTKFEDSLMIMNMNIPNFKFELLLEKQPLVEDEE